MMLNAHRSQLEGESRTKTAAIGFRIPYSCKNSTDEHAADNFSARNRVFKKNTFGRTKKQVLV